MIFRDGFVTNSSSSSFILMYNSEDLDKILKKELKEYSKDKVEECYEELMEFINNVDNEKEHFDEFLDDLKRKLYYTAMWDIQDKLEEKMNYLQMRAFLETDKGKKMINEKINEIVKDLKPTSELVDTIKYITIYDDYPISSLLEYYVVPNLSICKLVKSNH